MPTVDTATAVLQTGDIEIGAVEIKDGASDQRATVDASGALLADSEVATRTVKGYFQGTVTNTAKTLATLIGAAVPTGSKFCIVRVSQDARWRDDGTNPTAAIGMPILTGEEFRYNGDLAAIKFIRQASDATFDVTFYA